MAIIGIIGNSSTAAGDAIVASLTDLRDRAALNDEEFWAIVAIDAEPADAIGDVMQWLLDNEVAYDLVVHPDIIDELEAEITGPADKTFKVKAVAPKVLDRLIEYSGDTLLVLLGEDEPDNVISSVITKANENSVLAFDESLTEIAFEQEAPEEEAAEGGDDDLDFEALGASGDEGDDEAIATLTGLAEANDLNPDEFATWTELAEALHELTLDDAAEAAAPEEEAEGTWTQEALDAIKSLPDLRTIAKQAGIEGAAKMTRPNLIAALLGTEAVVAAPAEEEEAVVEEKPKPAAKGVKATNAGSSSASDDLTNAAAVFTAALLHLIREAVKQ